MKPHLFPTLHWPASYASVMLWVMGIREKVIEVAERRGVDYKELADKSGLPRPTVHRYFSGKADLTGGRIDKLLDALSLSVGRLRRTFEELRPKEFLFIEPLVGTKQLLRYPGSKWRLMPDLVRLMPRHQHYVVLFGGSGADILRKPPSPLETFNDLDEGVHNLFSVLQDADKLALLKNKVEATPAQSQRCYQEALATLRDSQDVVLKAWAFLVASFQGFCVSAPTTQHPYHWRYAKRPHTTARNWTKLPDIVEQSARRFQLVQLSNQSWQDVFRKTDSKTTLFIIDPPYYPGTLANNYYAHNLTAQQHEELVTAVNKANGFVILSGYANETYAKELSRWRAIEFGKTTTMGINGKRGSRTEMLWLNYDETGRRLR